MSDAKRLINAFLDGKIDLHTLDYQLDPSSPYYDEWLAKEKLRKEEEARASRRRPTGLDYFMQAKYTPSRGVYLPGDVKPLSGAAERGGQDDDYISERVRPPDPPGMVPDPYGFDKVADFLRDLQFKVVDKERLARQGTLSQDDDTSMTVSPKDQPMPGGRVNLPVYNKRDPFGINSSIGDLAVPDGTTVPMREPWEVEHEANFAKFKEMNPNLDYAKVAQQSGGNVPGGTLSVTDNEFWDDPSHPQSNQAYYDAVDKMVYEQELRSRQDPRSRGYDPTTAQQMIDAKIAERDASANEIYGKAQMLRAQAEGGQLEMARRAMEMENTPIGRARALTPIMLQSMSQVDPDLAVLIARATYMINSDDPMLQAQGLEMLSSLQGGNTNQAQVNKTGKPE